jgi:tRNA threonylcarbamoyladenosine biosynthesis protein TsaE
MRIEKVTEAKLKNIAQSVAETLLGNELICLDGELGAGKTTFSRYLLEKLGVTDVVSPTYSLHQIYHSRLGIVNHFDLYRIQDASDLESIGFLEVVLKSEITLIEWAKKLDSNDLPMGKRVISIEIGKYDFDHEDLRWVELKGVKPHAL